MARPAAVLAVFASWVAGLAEACPCCPTCTVCTCCPTCGTTWSTSGVPDGSTSRPVYQPTTTVTTTTQAPPLVCDLNCYGEGSSPVPLPGGNGNGVKADTVEVCRQYCYATEGCQAIIYGKGTCWGKKDIRTSKCQDGDGYVTEMLTKMPFGTCTLMGDPHVVTFDQRGGLSGTAPMTQTDPGDYWVVKASDLYIQGRFGYSSRFPSAASVIGIAVSGPLVMDNLLEVQYTGPAKGQDGFKAWWNGAQILNTGFPAYYKSDDNLLVASYNNMNPSNFSRQARSTIGGVSGNYPSYYFLLAPGISVYCLMGQETMNVVITLRKLQVPMDGYCGNFNCDASDDDLEDLEKRGLTQNISAKDSLFKNAPKPYPAQTHPGGKPYHLADCTGSLLSAAEQHCSHIHPAGLVEGCKYDYCASGGSDKAAKDDQVAAALLMTQQKAGIFGAIKFPMLGDLPEGVQGMVAFLIAGLMVSGVIVGTSSRPRRTDRHLLDTAADDWHGDQDEEEALLAPASEHEPLMG